MHTKAAAKARNMILVRLLKITRGKSLLALAIAALLLAFTAQGVSALGIDEIDNAAPHSTLQQDVNHVRDIGTVGVLAETSWETPLGVLINRARAGTMVKDTTAPVAWDSHIRIGSTTKTFVATVILQLEAEGKLSLSDQVDKWLPGVINSHGNDGKDITLRQLLQHTSGLPDYVADDDFLNTIITPEAFEANRFKAYTPEQLVAFSIGNPREFVPGSQWSYSNTGYIVAGMVIEKATGQPWAKAVKNRIITPLGLTKTSEPGTNPNLPSPFPRGYELFSDDGIYTDTTEHNMTWGGAAGSLISTPRDVNKFLRKLMQGKLLPPAQMAAMKTTVPMGPGYEGIWPGAAYGLGIIRSNLPCNNTYWHHGGDVVGYSDTNGVTADGKQSAMVASSTNTFADPEFAEGSIQYTNELVRNALCGYDTDPDSSPQTPPSVKNEALPGNEHRSLRL